MKDLSNDKSYYQLFEVLNAILSNKRALICMLNAFQLFVNSSLITIKAIELEGFSVPLDDEQQTSVAVALVFDLIKSSMNGVKHNWQDKIGAESEKKAKAILQQLREQMKHATNIAKEIEHDVEEDKRRDTVFEENEI